MPINKKDKDVFILGIESSCDETAASVVVNGRTVQSNVISSQIDIHQRYGGVVPEIASRKHIEIISQVVDDAMAKAGITFSMLNAVAATNRPGLIGALLVGLSYGKSLSYAIDKPFIGVHHIEGHISANYIEDPALTPPFVSLVVSGGHTHLVQVSDYGSYEIMGRTRDDAAGEAFDKVARALDLGYPGGPNIEKAARLGDDKKIQFPRAVLEEGSLDFSFSGVKSAVLNYLNKAKMMGETIQINDVAASFQEAVIDVLCDKAILACKIQGSNKLALAGGVACNEALRRKLAEVCRKNGIKLYMPQGIYCTDNAAMIACCGYYQFINGFTDPYDLNAYANCEVGNRF